MDFELNYGGQDYIITGLCIVLFMGVCYAYLRYMTDKDETISSDEYDNFFNENN